MTSHRSNHVSPALRARIDDIQLNRADREAVLRQLDFADSVASAVVRGLEFLRGLAPSHR